MQFDVANLMTASKHFWRKDHVSCAYLETVIVAGEGSRLVGSLTLIHSRKQPSAASIIRQITRHVEVHGIPARGIKSDQQPAIIEASVQQKAMHTPRAVLLFPSLEPPAASQWRGGDHGALP